jgi:ribosome-associated protein
MNTESAPAPPITEESELDRELLEVARGIAEVTWELKGLNTVVIDLRGRVSYTDFVIVTTGTSDRHVNALAKRIDEAMADADRKPLGTEGTDQGRWALLDYGDIIVHVFNRQARKDYDLERMWSEAPRLDLDDAPSDLYGHFEAEGFEV